MKTIELKDAPNLAEVLGQSAGEEVVVIRDGHAVALVVPFDDSDLEWYGRERDPEFVESIARARRQVAAGQTVGHAELKRQLGMD